MSDISKIDPKLRLEIIEWFLSRVMAQFAFEKIGHPTNQIDDIREQARQYVERATRGTGVKAISTGTTSNTITVGWQGLPRNRSLQDVIVMWSSKSSGRLMNVTGKTPNVLFVDDREHRCHQQQWQSTP